MSRPALVLVAMAFVSVGTVFAPGQAAGTVGTSFPPGFPRIIDYSLHVPVLGFGGKGGLRHVPVIFLHGNNDTSHPTDCNRLYGKIHSMAQYFADHGYSPSELWALSYEGDQCDLQTSNEPRASVAHTTLANVPDLRRFVRDVLRYTGARQVDIVGHSLGVTVAREWMRQDNAYGIVRRLVAVDGPNHGIISCSPDPRNFYGPVYGFTPDRPVCLEYGSDHSPLLRRLNAGDETPGPTRYLVIRNAETSFVYFAKQDGTLPPVPAQDREGKPHDFSQSARLAGAAEIDLTGQGIYDQSLLTAHLGIINSPETWSAAFMFLSRR